MRERTQARIAELKREHAAGIEQLAELQRREQDLRSTLLRISGAIQVLEELLASEEPAPPPPPPGP